MAATVRVPNLRVRIKPGEEQRLMETLARLVFEALERQAQDGLAPAKRGGQVTLHGYEHTRRIWQDVRISAGKINLNSPIAFLVREYGGDTLKPDYLAQVEREIAPHVAAALELAEE
jgi:hypothetical protein